jgi:single-stranded DNA-specific DHH superfamily exonuclease
MVPLLGESRTLSRYGLIVLNKTKRLGLQKLLLEARLMESDGSLKREIDADTIGFFIEPTAGRDIHFHTDNRFNFLLQTFFIKFNRPIHVGVIGQGKCGEA